MKIITFATLKGGAGKTTNCFNIAGVLAEQYRVLLIDVDPQCNLSNTCGVEFNDPDLKTVNDIFEAGEESPSPDSLITRAPIRQLPNLDIIPSSIWLYETKPKVDNAMSRESFFKYYILIDYKDFFERNYDYILIDTNPNMDVLNINAFYISDSIILSSDISVNSVLGAELFYMLWKKERKTLRIPDNVNALIMTKCNERTKISKEILSYSHDAEISQDIVCDTVIPNSVKINDAEKEHLPINLLLKHGKLRDRYIELTNELIEREVL